MDYAEDSAGGLIDDINSGNMMHCDGITVSYDAADGLIVININAGNSTDCADHAVGE